MLYLWLGIVILVFSVHTSLYSMQTSLSYAVCLNDSEQVKQLLAADADVNAQDKNGYTILHWAVRQGYDQCIQKLLAAGADPIIGEGLGNTPLDIAVRRIADNTQLIIKLLFKPSLLCGVQRKRYTVHLATVPVKNLYNNLFHAVFNNEPLPIDVNQNQYLELINQQDELGATLFMYAATLGRATIVQRFLMHADPFIKTKRGKTARTLVEHILMYAEQQKHMKTLSHEQRTAYNKILRMLKEKENEIKKECCTVILLSQKKKWALAPQLLSGLLLMLSSSLPIQKMGLKSS